jgi:hypothetical protein
MGWWRAQDVGPEFKPQYAPTPKEEISENFNSLESTIMSTRP